MNTKIKCLLLDDELPGLSYLKILCGQIDGVEVVKAFNDSFKFVQEAPQLDFDICILDIEMPGINGLQVAQSLGSKPVIFTTAYKEYAADAFDLNAIDYIRKPIQKERLEKALHKAADTITVTEAGKQFMQLNTSRGKARLFFNQVLLITTAPVDKRDKIAWLENGEELLLKNISFAQLLSALPSNKFCQVNKKDILALKTVAFFSHNEITTSVHRNGRPLQFLLSDTYKAVFLEKIAP